MSIQFSRRSVLKGGIGLPIAALAAGPAEAAGGGQVWLTTGFFEVVEGGSALIGLLLPAVQRPREDARLLLVDALGRVVSNVPVEGSKFAFFDIREARDPLASSRILEIRERETNRSWQVTTLDGVLLALLLPAVQRNGESAGIIAGSVQLFAPDGSLQDILPYLEQDALYRQVNPQGGGVGSVGPFLSAEGTTSRIGMLIPAVQVARLPHKSAVVNSRGELIAVEELPPPPASQARHFFAAQYEAVFSDGRVRVQRLLGDGSVRSIGEGPSPDGILTALVLPAVLGNGFAVPAIGGSAQAAKAKSGMSCNNNLKQILLPINS